MEQTVFQCRLRLIATDALFGNWHCVENFDIRPFRSWELFSGYRSGGSATSVLVFYTHWLLSFSCAIWILRFPMITMIYASGGIRRAFGTCLISFVASALYDGWCSASSDLGGVEDFCRGSILLHLSQGVLDFVEEVGFLEIFCGCTVDALKENCHSIVFQKSTQILLVVSNGFRIRQSAAFFPTFGRERFKGVSVF